jgi:flagellar biogenesis protein FliO
MRSALVLVPEAVRASGPDLTRYLAVCAGTITALGILAWVFRRFVARHVRARAARRSLQVLDVLPLSGKQKLVVVRCYDRSFLLGVGDREVRGIAELDAPDGEGGAAADLSLREARPFGQALDELLAPRALQGAGRHPRADGSRSGRGAAPLAEGGVLA